MAGNTNIVIFIIFGACCKVAIGLNICGLEEIQICNPCDLNCLANKLYPAVLNWAKDGQPSYFIESVDPIFYKKLKVPVYDGSYYFHNVSISKILNSHLDNFSLGKDYNNGFINLTYVFNLEVKADSFYKIDDDGKKTNKKIFHAHMDNIAVDSFLPIRFAYRCDETRYLDILPEWAFYVSSPNNVLTIDKGSPILSDLEIFKYNFLATFSEIAAKKVNNMYRELYTQIEADEILVY